jgi:Mg2+ and Co2+ transporter CorA
MAKQPEYLSIDIREDVQQESHETTSLISQNTPRKNSIQSGLKTMSPLPGMQISCHLIGKHGSLSISTPQEALSGAKCGNNHYWIDIDADPHGADELREWLKNLNLPPFVIDVLAEPPEMWASQVIPLQRAALAVIRILPENPESNGMTHVAALHLRNMLITFTSCPRSDTAGLYAPALAQMKQAERLPSATSSGALLAWLRYHLERTSRATRELRHAVLAMDEAMDRHITSVHLNEIISVKDQLLRILSVAEEQTECLESLAAAGSEGQDFASLKGSLSTLVATAGATERMGLRLEKQVLDLRQRSENHEQEIMNRRLAFLTALSAVFLPLTLFTGIWGMNFQNMPELNKQYSYPLALGFMITLGASMICYFRRSGWFD